MLNRKEEIKKKGFSMAIESREDLTYNPYTPVDFSKIKLGLKTLEDATIKVSNYCAINPRMADRKAIFNALYRNNYEAMREISNFYYKVSGIYQRLCKYMANLYRYDWFVTPYVPDSDNVQKDKLEKEFYRVLTFLDDFNAKKVFGDIALKVIRNGCYYGYIVSDNGQTVNIQELDPNYCRSRYFVKGTPTVEFNLKYFDDKFRDSIYRNKVLNLFPPEFKKAYKLYKQGKLQPIIEGEDAGWYLLQVGSAFKFNINGEDIPMFLSVIPSIIDLDEAKELDKKKMAQELLKIVIQKLPLDKNGDLIFDVDEAKELHNNAVRMLSKAIGIDVLTTFADTEVEDMSDSQSSSRVDNLERVERAVFNAAGVSQMLYNTSGNIALEKSILNDEAAMYNLLAQFQHFLNYLLTPFNTKPKKYSFSVELLTTTIYNYKEMSKLYKEQTSLGYSKMLPQIALGHSQRSILATAVFENKILELFNIFIPPLSSNTMSSDVLKKNAGIAEEKTAGRKELPNDEKSEKTIQNRESMN